MKCLESCLSKNKCLKNVSNYIHAIPSANVLYIELTLETLDIMGNNLKQWEVYIAK